MLTRLHEAGVDQTELEEEWEALKATEPDEERFCLAAAALGLDPFVLGDDIASLILLADERLAQELEQDFLAAADPNRLAEDLDWIEHTSGLIDSSSAKTAKLPTITSAVDGAPWHRGAQQAMALREALAVAETEAFEVDPWVVVRPVDEVDPSLEALGGFSKRGGQVLALAGKRPAVSRRFSAGRSLYRFVVDAEAHPFLITGAHASRQQAERAFAAELLAPAQGIKKFIPLHADYLDVDDVAAISEHFNVSEWVVRYQVLNRLDIEVDEPIPNSTS
ncbi:MAG: ImmA/IrrE family metallo-endopeptidase [Egibacteraceae bacterium]